MKILYTCFFSFFLLLNLSSLDVYAQRKLSGRILGPDQLVLSGATVTAFNKEQQPLRSVVTTGAGNFTIPVVPGTSSVVISHVGYIPFLLTDLSKDSVTVTLQLQTGALAEVTVRAQKPLIEQKFDGLVVNVDGSPKAGMNANDVLRKIPGVALINDTEYRLEGKSVSILIDGRPTRLSGSDLQRLLNSTLSSVISQIEVIYNPSAKFDAQGEGGIINIKTLKRTKPGYDGNLSLTGGHGWKYFSNNDLSGALNYRSGNDYWFGGYSYSFGKQSQEIQKNTYLDQAGIRLRDSTVYQTPYRSQNLRLGWDHYVNKTDVFGALITAYQSRSEPFTTIHTGIAQLNALNVDSTRYAEDRNPRTSRGINLNMNYKTVLDSALKRELSMDADAGLFRSANENELNSVLKNGQGASLSPLQSVFQSGTTLSQIYSYKLDLSQKLYQGNLEVGLKGSYVQLRNNFVSPADKGSNDFDYRESILAGYVNIKQVFGKLTVQAGLRAEQTQTKGNSITIDSVVNRAYLNLFPNLTLTYKSKKSSVSLAYSRRIGRPTYNYLNPFSIYRGPYNIYQGNPYLKPSFTDNLRLGVNPNSKFSFSTNYSFANDVITDLQLQNETNKVTTSLKANLSRYRNLGLNAGYYDKWFGSLDVSLSAGTSYSIYEFNVSAVPVRVEQQTGYLSADNRLDLPHDLWLEVFFYGQTRVTYGNQINLPFTTTGLSGGKKVLKGKGNISFTINDIFFVNITRSEAAYANVRNDLRSKYDSRNFRLNFTYNFGNAKVDVRRRSSGSSDEQRRDH